MTRTLRRAILATAVTLCAGTVLAAWFAPYLYAEYSFDWHGSTPKVQPSPTVPVQGRWVDDYFLVQQLDASTIAIGEPRYYQGNYSYLVLGGQRAVLYDAGSGLRDIVPLVRSLTSLPVTVIPSHLHFDHVGALGRFDKTAMIDAATLRERAKDSVLTLDRYEFLGFADRLPEKKFRVDEWWSAGSLIDLGGRRLRVLSTPGHTPVAVSLYDEDRHQLFVGDFFYPSYLYAFLPGASRSAYLASAGELLKMLATDTRIFGAHMTGPPGPIEAPEMRVGDLQALPATLVGIEDGTAPANGFFPRVYAVRDGIKFLTGWSFNNR